MLPTKGRQAEFVAYEIGLDRLLDDSGRGKSIPAGHQIRTIGSFFRECRKGTRTRFLALQAIFKEFELILAGLGLRVLDRLAI